MVRLKLFQQQHALGLPQKMIQTGPAETFMAAQQIGTIVTVLLGSPWVIYQLWLFVAPGLYSNERRFVHILLPLSGLLTAISIAFLYTVVMPMTVSFFLLFGSSFPGPSTAPSRRCCRGWAPSCLEPGCRPACAAGSPGCFLTGSE
jgi:Sec-independent protein secretion pathway component TatC